MYGQPLWALDMLNWLWNNASNVWVICIFATSCCMVPHYICLQTSTTFGGESGPCIGGECGQLSEYKYFALSIVAVCLYYPERFM